VLGQALETAGELGARTVSLTGLLPSATGYGRALAQAVAGRDVPRITTGHATTTAAVMLAVRRILEEAGRDLTQERVGFLGLGSIGTASLQMLLRCLPHPAEILLCDVYSKRDALSALRRQLAEELGYRGPVRVLEARGGVPAGMYEASLLIGATNVPDILDVDRLAPGTLLVDDSNPHCFRLDRAIRRLRERQDLLFTEGGMLRAAAPLGHVLYIPEALEQTARDLPADLFANYDPHHVMGCVLSGLLSARRPDLPPTVGLTVLRACQAHYEAVTSLGFRAAALHCENYALEEGAIRNFRRHFGRRIDALEPAAAAVEVEEAMR
jgi:predicted amino acid dehydrogenase